MDTYEKKYRDANNKVAARFGTNVAKEIFTDLYESEDEKIRKELITHCRNTRCVTEEGAERIAKWIAWLEKQGEHKPIEMKSAEESLGISSEEYNDIVNECLYGESKSVDKVEPKFHEGDWVLNNVCFPVQIASVKDGMYILTDGDALSVSFVDETYHLWTKSSDENKKLTDVNHEYFSELLENNDSEDINDYAYQVAYCMSHDWIEETATWDDVQKACKLGAEWNEKRHKSAWSEKDENKIDTIISIYHPSSKIVNLFKSLKQRIGG